MYFDFLNVRLLGGPLMYQSASLAFLTVFLLNSCFRFAFPVTCRSSTYAVEGACLDS